MNDGRTFLEVFLGCVDQLERNKLETALLETGDDRADECALNAIGLIHNNWYLDPKPLVFLILLTQTHLDHNVRALSVVGHDGCYIKRGDNSRVVRCVDNRSDREDELRRGGMRGVVAKASRALVHDRSWFCMSRSRSNSISGARKKKARRRRRSSIFCDFQLFKDA
jgi:hypothetical protein